jgi:hypothetical protein
MPFSRADPDLRQRQLDRGFKELSSCGVRIDKAVLPVILSADPLLAFPLRGFILVGLGLVLPRNLLSWASVRS